MSRALRNTGRPGLGWMALSAVDVALWDLKAKLLGVPLAALLGRPATPPRPTAAAARGVRAHLAGSVTGRASATRSRPPGRGSVRRRAGSPRES
ncbi:hypothetical protein [Nannocystis pusilla]